MNKYEPSIAPNPDQWLSIPEIGRIELVKEYHEKFEDTLQADAITAHSSIHVIVENQIALNYDPVPQTVAKLMRQGLSRHEAIHAIGAVFIDIAGDLIRIKDSSWNNDQYKKKLDKLTAKRWRKGQW